MSKYIIKNSAAKWLNTMLTTIVATNPGPTRVTRFLYLGSCILYYILSNNAAHDMTETELKHAINATGSTEYLIHFAFKKLYGQLGYTFSITDPSTITLSYANQIKQTRLHNFLDNRDNDGWKNFNTPAITLPNGSNFIDVENGASQDLSSLLPQPDKWTPLKHGNNITQTYLTPRWGDVTLPVSTPLSDYTNIADANIGDAATRELEVREMINIYQNLTNTQRAIAEYFEGGQVTPPGIWNVYAIYTASSQKLSSVNFAKFLYNLNTALFSASIVCWKVKFTHMQARPIQEIRKILPLENVTTWDTSVVQNNVWKPWQRLNGRTPPFPDFMSGHSTFSSAAAVVFDHFFPKALVEIEFEQFTPQHATMIQGFLDNGLPNTVKHVSVNVGSSAFPQGDSPAPFPTTSVCLDFKSWQELAELSGISRIYGGIHCQSANQTALIIGNKIGLDVLAERKP